MRPRDRSLPEDIVENARVATDALEGLDDEGVAEIAPFYTASHALMIVGEAAAKLGEDVRLAATDVPWRKIVDTRNLIVHAYYKTDPLIVAGIVRGELPQLIARLEQLLRNDPE